MNNHQILRTIQECSHLLNIDPDSSTLTGTDSLDREYDNEELVEFIRDLVESGSDSGMILLEKHLGEKRFKEFMLIHESPIVVFAKDNELAPVIIHKKGKKYHIQKIKEHEVEILKTDNLDDLDLACTDKLEVIFLSVFDYESLVSDQDSTKTNATYITPLKRLFKLLSAEKIKQSK